jgi:prolyl 4-hydroxylase
MKNLTDFMMCLDNAIPDTVCDSLIQKFENADDLVYSNNDWGFDYRSFHELTLTTHPDFAEEQKVLYNTSQKLYNFYKEKCNIQFFPEKIGYEDVRMKRYRINDEDQIGWHTDVGDYASSRRFLVMFYYLNDVEEGGETVFSDVITNDMPIKVLPKKGRVVIFPAMWMYPHKGMKPLSNDKYIVSTYCHYL